MRQYLDEGAQLLEGNAFRPIVSCLALGPTCLGETLFQIIKCALRRMIDEGYDLSPFCPTAGSAPDNVPVANEIQRLLRA